MIREIKRPSSSFFVDGKKTLVGIFRTEGVKEPFVEWYNGGIIWKGKHSFLSHRQWVFHVITIFFLLNSSYVLSFFSSPEPKAHR